MSPQIRRELKVTKLTLTPEHEMKGRSVYEITVAKLGRPGN